MFGSQIELTVLLEGGERIAADDQSLVELDDALMPELGVGHSALARAEDSDEPRRGEDGSFAVVVHAPSKDRLDTARAIITKLGFVIVSERRVNEDPDA